MVDRPAGMHATSLPQAPRHAAPNPGLSFAPSMDRMRSAARAPLLPNWVWGVIGCVSVLGVGLVVLFYVAGAGFSPSRGRLEAGGAPAPPASAVATTPPRVAPILVQPLNPPPPAPPSAARLTPPTAPRPAPPAVVAHPRFGVRALKMARSAAALRSNPGANPAAGPAAAPSVRQSADDGDTVGAAERDQLERELLGGASAGAGPEPAHADNGDDVAASARKAVRGGAPKAPESSPSEDTPSESAH